MGKLTNGREVEGGKWELEEVDDKREAEVEGSELEVEGEDDKSESEAEGDDWERAAQNNAMINDTCGSSGALFFDGLFFFGCDSSAFAVFLFLFSGGLEFGCKLTTIALHRRDFVLMVTASPICRLPVAPVSQWSLEVDSM